MKQYLAVVTAIFLVANAQAALVGRDITGAAVAGNAATAVFLYDDVLNVTWLRDANHAQTSGYDGDGRMTWASANAWAANLVVGAYNDWRLPTMIDGSSACDLGPTFSGTSCGYNVPTKSGNLTQHEAGQTIYSEMASLWYDTLGNKADFTTTGAVQSGSGLVNRGDFQNLQANAYWSALAYGDGSTLAWSFTTATGGQFLGSVLAPRYALAVRSGDVAPSAVPIPAALPLLLSGLAPLLFAAKRRTRRPARQEA